ncbi:hypothetical protein [Microbacterium luteum]|nr:hypothetical protein [Microbacterium luteum]
MSEKHAALLTAGVILSGLGLFFITIPAGLLSGARSSRPAWSS